ncbi:hypothetical protein [uncultured Paenibacillus sp.]|uniref:hypothetical protein n=1 Tax=uncultured Paenibacillus sp. TaxID=227322 RepID=UPI0015A98CCB|nr:hypothetical protein [uncultured Paenibacillus sp.]
MSNRIKLFISNIAIFSVFATSAFAATGTADKPLNSSSSVESVSIQGNGAQGTHYTNLYAGTGSGTGKLYRFIRFWPDELLNTHNVASGQGPVSLTTTFNADWDAAYNVVAAGSSSAGIRTSVVIN